ncbi:MAG: hypothetical protein APF77_05450 [Clostridia bacterium BRH_c25]|nr:MAG: hypothetical protein APF77_05450 [Clostridia bacterium BRH_c25]
MIKVVDKNSSVPMYEQIVQILKKEILQRKYGESGCIGTHTELTQRFGVSLITIKKAIGLLADESLVIIKQGKGTFVKNAVLNDRLDRLTGISNIMSETNITPTVLVKTMRKIETPSYFEKSVKSALGKECYYIARAHMIDNVVAGYAKLYLPLEYGLQLSPKDIETNTIYQIYQNKLGVPLGKGVQHIRASKADKALAEVLNVKLDTPLLFIQRESYGTDKQLIEFMELYFEYTQYAFKIELDLSAF